MTPTQRASDELLDQLIDDCDVAWSIGRHGAIAEFARTREERVDRMPLGVVSALGALRLDTHPQARLFAWESPARGRLTWLQRLAWCLPEAIVARSWPAASTTVADAGSDVAAIRPQDRAAHLYDLGVGGPFIRTCVRVESGPLRNQLAHACATRALENVDLLHALVRASPPRVFLSPLGRLEVYQPIPQAHGTAPEGPHTHFLPALLEQPDVRPDGLPDGWVACVMIYPPNPMFDAHGSARAFDPSAHARFQQLLTMFGDPALLAVKREVREAVRADRPPKDFPVHPHHRPTVLVALRQLQQTDGDNPALARWRAAFELNPVD